MRMAPQESRTYFLTFVIAERRRVFQVSETAQLMKALLEENRDKGRFELYAFVIMPDHLHVLLTPAPEVSLEKAVQFIKGGFSFRLKSKMDVWQRGYNEAQIKSAEQFEAVRAYILQNPVRKGIVDVAEDFDYSSAGRPELVDPCPIWLV